MKSLMIGKSQERSMDGPGRLLAQGPEGRSCHRLNRVLKAAVLVAAAGCNESAQPPPVSVIELPSPPAVQARRQAPVEGAKAPESLVPTTMTMLRTGNVFLAYVSVPDGDGMRDLEDPKSSFYYSAPKGNWSVIAGCESAFSCDASAVILGNPSGVRIKAEFSEPGYRPCASEPHPAAAP